jgi:aconitate hydratase
MERGEAAPVGILSGNRNFPGRVHPLIEDAFLASPPLVVAYALGGDAAVDIAADPIAGTAVRLADLWPTGAEIDAIAAMALRPDDYGVAYDAAEASSNWAALAAPIGALYPWDERSTYLRRPPFARIDADTRLGHYSAVPILVLGDDITTDHISPAGAIPRQGEAGQWLVERGEDPQDLNVFSSRRGNWEVMLRGLFTNRSVRNLLGPDIPAGDTVIAGTTDPLPLWQAADLYRHAGTPVVIVAGERYGMGSSRDWAAKGAALLGARAVLASSFERIHRSNLVNMGVLPLRLPSDRHPDRMKLAPGDRLEIVAGEGDIAPGVGIAVTLLRANGGTDRFTARAEIETMLEIETLKAGGMIALLLRRTMAAAA